MTQEMKRFVTELIIAVFIALALMLLFGIVSLWIAPKDAERSPFIQERV